MTTPAILYDNVPARIIEPDKSDDAKPTAPVAVLYEQTTEYETIMEDPNEGDFVIVDADDVSEIDDSDGGGNTIPTNRPLSMHNAMNRGQSTTSMMLRFLHEQTLTITQAAQSKANLAWEVGTSAIRDTTHRLHEDILEPTSFNVSQTYSWFSDTISSQLSNGSSQQQTGRFVFSERIVDIGEPLVCNVVLEEPDENDDLGNGGGSAMSSQPAGFAASAATPSSPGQLITPAGPPTMYEIETDADVFDYHIVNADDLDRDTAMYDAAPNATASRQFFDLTNHQPEVLARILFHAALTGGFLVADSAAEHSARVYTTSKTCVELAQRKWSILKEVSPVAARTSAAVERGFGWVSQPARFLFSAPNSGLHDGGGDNDGMTYEETYANAIEMSERNQTDIKNRVSHKVKLTQ